jgi:hypothetical protein
LGREWDDQPRWRREARQRQRKWDDQPGDRDDAPSLATWDPQATLDAQVAEHASEMSVYNGDEAAWLYTQGIPLRRILATDRGTPVYVFLSEEGRAVTLREAFIQGQAVMDVQRFAKTERVLRSWFNVARNADNRTFVVRDPEGMARTNGEQGRSA